MVGPTEKDSAFPCILELPILDIYLSDRCVRFKVFHRVLPLDTAGGVGSFHLAILGNRLRTDVESQGRAVQAPFVIVYFSLYPIRSLWPHFVWICLMMQPDPSSDTTYTGVHVHA